MIFVTVGTDAAPFDRLVRAVELIDGAEPVVIQHGASRLRPRGATCFEYLPFEEIAENMRLARAVITHAGVGSILVAIEHGTRPIVVPRRRRFGEAVDDHQSVLAERLARKGLVTLVEDPKLLPRALTEHQDHTAAVLRASRLALDIREYLVTHLGSESQAA